MNTRTPWKVLASILILVVASACSTQPESAATEQLEDPFFDSLRVLGEDAEVYDGFQSLSDASDIVALGSITDFHDVRLFQGDAVEDKVFYGQARFEIVEFVEGRQRMDDAKSVTMEFILPSSDLESANRELKRLNENTPDGMLLAFLRDKGSGEAGLYRAVNSFGLWMDGINGLDAPLTFPEEAAEFRSSSLPAARSVAELAEAVKG